MLVVEGEEELVMLSCLASSLTPAGRGLIRRFIFKHL